MVGPQGSHRATACSAETRSAIPCASGTHALIAAAALAERQGPLRWLAPDYAFRSTAIGPLPEPDSSTATVMVPSTPPCLAPSIRDSYDAAAVLNPFGLFGSLSNVVDFTRTRSKALIIDNAHGLLGFARNDHDGVFECISLHHTKPFGFGEGGCLDCRPASGGGCQAGFEFRVWMVFAG